MTVTLNPKDTIPSKDSVASDWILWHKALKKNYGKATANHIWLTAWRKRGCAGMGCDANTAELREYIAEQGIKIEGGTWDFVPDAWESWTDKWTQAYNIGSYTVIAVIVILVGFLALVAWNLGRDPQGAIGTAVKLRTGGLA